LSAVNLNSKISAFIFSAVYLFSSVTVSELFKLPVLISHYSQYREDDRSATLGKFLMQHYFYETGTDQDANEDNQLPFKSIESINTVSLVSLTPPVLAVMPVYNNMPISISFGLYKNPYLLCRYVKNIWQPPRPNAALIS
jgi:hypothetical protein